MKNNLILFLLITFLLSNCSDYQADLEITSCEQSGSINPAFSKASALELTLAELTNKGVPGCAIAVYSDEGYWTSATGFAKIEDRIVMEPCHLQYLQSIAKTYMAVAILQLYEQGKIVLDAPMTQYLPAKYSRYFSKPDKVTVRMLLNHTSGLPDYNFAPAFVSYYLQHPTHPFTSEDYLKNIEGKPFDSEPGSRYAYRNTNYLLLALIADAITGDHAKFISDHIFAPLGLDQSFYRHEAGYPNFPTLTNAYWDRYSDGIVENVSQMQRANVATLIGDDGIVATPIDAVKFLKGLMEGQLLSAETMEQMKTWVLNTGGEPTYGLGLGYETFNGVEAYGHSGGGVGAGCELCFIPEKNLYFFVAINLGTVTGSPIHKDVEPVVDELHRVLTE